MLLGKSSEEERRDALRRMIKSDQDELHRRREMQVEAFGLLSAMAVFSVAIGVLIRHYL